MTNPADTKPTNPNTPQNHLDLALKAHTQAVHIQNNFTGMIDIITPRGSFINRASLYWSNQAIWKKILWGIIVFVPALLTGIFAHVPVLITIGVLALVIYASGSFLLQNHNKHQGSIISDLKHGIGRLAQLLSSMYPQLIELGNEFKSKIDSFSTENKALATTITQNGNQEKNLKQEIAELTAAKDKCSLHVKKLKQVLDEMDLLTKKSRLQRKEEREKLTKTLAEFEDKITNLSNTIAELKQTSTQIIEELDKAIGLGETLRKSVNDMVNLVLKDEQQQSEFKKRLETTFSNQEQCAAVYADCLEKIEKELSSVTKKIVLTRDEHRALCGQNKHLLERQDKAITSLEQINQQSDPINKAKALKKFGIYAPNCQPDQSMEHENALLLHKDMKNEITCQ